MEDHDLSSHGAADSIGEARYEQVSALRFRKDYADLRSELAAILAEFEDIPITESIQKLEISDILAFTRPERKLKKAAAFITGSLFYIVLAAIVVSVFLLSYTNSATSQNIFGYSAMIMLTGSMQSEIPKDSLVITRRTDPENIKLGDDISYLIGSDFIVTHRVIGIHEQYTENGDRGFVTKGTDNENADREVVPAANVIGRVVFHHDRTGSAILLIKQNLVLTIFACVLLITLITLIRFFAKRRR